MAGTEDERRPGEGVTPAETCASLKHRSLGAVARSETSILAERPLTGWILPRSDGTFEPLVEFEPGALWAEFLHIPGDGGEIIDTVGWERGRPDIWWLRCDLVTHVGDHELEAAWGDQRPARLLATPADWVEACGAGFVILDWSADINVIIGRVSEVECATSELERHLRQTLIRLAMPRGLTITAASAPRRAPA